MAHTPITKASLEWESYDDYVHAYDSDGVERIEIGPLADMRAAVKWGDAATPGRDWVIYSATGEPVTFGHAPNLSRARRDALAALNATVED